MNKYLIYLALASILSFCEAYKILVVFPLAGRSHANLGDGIVRHLLKAGHEVTYVTHFDYKSDASNLRLINVMSHDVTPPPFSFEALMSKELDFSDLFQFIPVMIMFTNGTLHHEKFQKILHDPKEQFDLMITEWMFTDVLSGLSAVYNCPYIWVSSLGVHWAMMRLIDQSPNPAYTADIMSLNLPPFTFLERASELHTQIKGNYLRYMYFDDIERQIYENSLAPIVAKRGRQAPSYSDVQYNASLVLANSHESLGDSNSIPHNYIPIGGFHIEDDVKPLPEDLKKIMDNAQHGVVYFSMGSNLKSKDMPKVIKDSFLKIFGELKQTVLWKFEEDLPNTPKNVHIFKWMPQQSILAHPKTLVFVTHGGLLSTTEAVHFGVPIIGIPVFADQFSNVARAVKRGYAYEVELSYEMADKLKAAILEVIGNSKYAEKVKELSFIYHNRPVAPGKQIQHWVRHVIETRGALHLRSPAFNVPFYQRAYLDLIAVILVSLFVIIKFVKCVCKVFCSKKNVSPKKKTN